MAKKSVRELIHNLSTGAAVSEDGSLTIEGVTLLATGTWTDSAYGTPLFYPEKVLEEYATNWYDSPLWSRHGGGAPRSITDKIGEIENQRYADGKVLGDLILHGLTQTSKDTIELITSGLVNAISVEHSGRERWDPDEQSYVAEELIFYGAAIVNKGACTVCTFNNEASREEAEADMELKELETKLVEAEARITELSEASATKTAELEDKITELEAKITGLDQTDTIKGLETKITELETAKIAELEGRIKKVEKTPMQGVTMAGDDGKELGDIMLSPIITDAEGITRRMF